MALILPLLGAVVAAKAAGRIWSKPGRAAVVRAAAGELGKGNPAKYWADAAPGAIVAPGTAWCGGFCLWALHQAGLMRGIYWQFGTGFLFRLPTTPQPKPGDIGFFTAYQHQAIVEKLNPGGTVTLINGNGTGGVVTRSTGPASAAAAYYSIAGLVGETS